MSSAQISSLVFAVCDGRSYGGSYSVADGRVSVRSRLGQMSARLIGDPAMAARALLEVIVSLHLSAQQAAET